MPLSTVDAAVTYGRLSASIWRRGRVVGNRIVVDQEKFAIHGVRERADEPTPRLDCSSEASQAKQ